MSTDAGRVATPLGFRIGVALVGLLLVAVVVSPPVRTLLNGIPLFYEVFYVVLTVAAGALVVWSAYTHQGALAIGTWAVLFWAAACSAVYVFGGSRLFFLLGRAGAIAFIIIETVSSLLPARSVQGEA